MTPRRCFMHWRVSFYISPTQKTQMYIDRIYIQHLGYKSPCPGLKHETWSQALPFNHLKITKPQPPTRWRARKSHSICKGKKQPVFLRSIIRNSLPHKPEPSSTKTMSDHNTTLCGCTVVILHGFTVVILQAYICTISIYIILFEFEIQSFIEDMSYWMFPQNKHLQKTLRSGLKKLIPCFCWGNMFKIPQNHLNEGHKFFVFFVFRNYLAKLVIFVGTVSPTWAESHQTIGTTDPGPCATHHHQLPIHPTNSCRWSADGVAAKRCKHLFAPCSAAKTPMFKAKGKIP